MDLHDSVLKDFSELAEQIFTLPTIRRIAGASEFDGFNTWCSQCSNSIMHFCNVAIAKLILETLPDKCYDAKTMVISEEAAPKDHRWPLFLVT